MAGHLQIGDGAQIGAQAGVISDVEPRRRMLGSPAQPVREFFRQIAMLKKLLGEARQLSRSGTGGATSSRVESG